MMCLVAAVRGRARGYGSRLRRSRRGFLRITCDRCGKDRMLNEVHAPERQRDMPIRVLLPACAMTAAAAEWAGWSC
jgi:hypothetical protein